MVYPIRLFLRRTTKPRTLVVGFVDGEFLDEDKFVNGVIHLDEGAATLLINDTFPATNTLGVSIFHLATEFDKFYAEAARNQSAATTGK